MSRSLRRTGRWGGLLWFALAAGCAHQADARAPHQIARVTPPPPPDLVLPPPPEPPPPPVTLLAEPPPPTAKSFVTWIRERLPEGGEVEVARGEAPLLFHTAQPGQSIEKIASLYLPLSDVYLLPDFAAAIRKANPKSRYVLKPGTRLAIPHLVSAPYLEGDAARLGWPADRVLKGRLHAGRHRGRQPLRRHPRPDGRPRHERHRPRHQGHRRPPYLQVEGPRRGRDQGDRDRRHPRPRPHHPLRARPRHPRHPAHQLLPRRARLQGAGSTCPSAATGAAPSRSAGSTPRTRRRTSTSSTSPGRGWTPARTRSSSITCASRSSAPRTPTST